MSGQAKYVGRLVFLPLRDGRLMQLLEPFGFIDPTGLDWPVPSGTQVDGASIPQALWSLVGSPFTGLYRDASVIHDYYCDVPVRPWKKVHRVFYDAMITSGVSSARAKLMYAAVYYAGPRWPTQKSHNAKLPIPSMQDTMHDIEHSPFTKKALASVEADGISVADYLRSGSPHPPTSSDTRLHLKTFEQLIMQYDPSPEEIERALDASTDLMDAFGPKQKLLVDIPSIN